MTTSPGELTAALVDAVGADHVLTDADRRAPYEVDWTRRWHGECLAVVRPASAAEVAAVVRACAAAGAVVVPQGGNTGLVGGGVPRAAAPGGRRQVVLSTSRRAGVGPVVPKPIVEWLRELGGPIGRFHQVALLRTPAAARRETIAAAAPEAVAARRSPHAFVEAAPILYRVSVSGQARDGEVRRR